jgi:outer membrane protein TolC
MSTRAAARSVDIATRQYEKGLISYQPLLDSERVLTQQQDTLTESRGLVGIHLVEVYKALGGGWQALQTPPPPPPAPTAEPVPAP